MFRLGTASEFFIDILGDYFGDCFDDCFGERTVGDLAFMERCFGEFGIAAISLGLML